MDNEQLKRLAEYGRYRIVWVDDGSPCHWQLQKVYFIFFWFNVGNSFSSATTAANTMTSLVKSNLLEAATDG